MISDRWNVVASLDVAASLLERIWKRCEAYCFTNNHDDILPIARIGPVAAIYRPKGGRFMAESVKSVNGQCGTCKWALKAEYDLSTSASEGRICCTPEAHVRYCCEQTGHNFSLDFFKENGYVLWLRLEVLMEESYVCPHWEPKDSEIRDQ